MAEMLILLRRDPATGKQNIVVKLESDPDALPIEHEQMHRTIVEKLVGKGIQAEDLGHIVIEREPAKTAAPPADQQEPGERQKTGAGQ